MGKFFVPPVAHTPADRLRESLDRAERLMPTMHGSGHQVLELLHLLDQAAGSLAELDAIGVDVRAESARLETVQRQLRRRQSRFLAEAGAVLREERAAVQPNRAQWWWFLDEAVAEQRRRRLWQTALWGLVVVSLCGVVWLAYERFIAPPPEVSQAFQHSAAGEDLVAEGDLRAALAEFERAAALTPDDSALWIWQGVIHFELDELDAAQEDFDLARSLHETDSDFLRERGMAYLRVGDLDAARVDIEQAIAEEPQSGWGYYLRASIATEEEDYAAAIADLKQAEELARAAGNTQLEATARTQQAMLMQLLLRSGAEGGREAEGKEQKGRWSDDTG
ncbi:MAG: tetratricopeptide repeat protein [Chloroflexota bacterium]|nr:tetratricopeptide repeat protein [Chloroflexota bacterium]